jgi:hypothetical protein
MRVTDALLSREDACWEQHKLFRKLYPHGANTTEASLRRAAKAGLSIGWLERFIPPAADKAYYEATAPARKAYNQAIAPAMKAYDAAVAAAVAKAYYEAVAPALAKALRGVKP